MEIIHQPRALEHHGRKVMVAIGTFDGVHLGHQQVIRQCVADAEQHEGLAVVVTFDRHPSTVVAPERVPALIYTLPQKLRAIGSLGPHATLLIHFDAGFASRPGEVFIRELAHDLGRLHSISVGSSFSFGHKRSGNVELLKRLGAELGFNVHGLAAVALDSQAVSSTRIREAIRLGSFDRAAEMLGRPYSLCGLVTRGDGIGRQLGFPTANLDVAGMVLPPSGVYAAHAYVRGRPHRAVLNIGRRPTLRHPEPQLRVEAHLLSFSEDIYGAELEVTFVARLRDEQRFPSLDALRAQIQQDIASASTVF